MFATFHDERLPAGHPDQTKARIVSMTFLHPPHLIGDGMRSVAQMVDSDPILHSNAAIYRQCDLGAWDCILERDQFRSSTNAHGARLGAVYRDALDQVTPALQAVIGRISQEIPDIPLRLVRHPLSQYRRTAGVAGTPVVELNGAGAQMPRIWAGIGTLRGA